MNQNMTSLTPGCSLKVKRCFTLVIHELESKDFKRVN